MSNPETESEKFDRELADFLAQHGKKREDIQFPSMDVAKKTVVEHIHTIQDRARKHDYKRLRGFSGKLPVPNGELPFSTWYLHAEQMLSEASLTEEEKRLRLSECLSPPALTLYKRAAEELGPLATGTKLLEQLGRAFGVACEGEDLYTRFRDTYQEKEEAASTYLLRLDERLDQAIQFGGVDRRQADKLRLSQFIRGCIFSEGLVSNLQLRQRKAEPPTLVGLLREVRIEEAEEAARLTRRENARAPRKAQVNHTTVEKPAQGKSDLNNLSKQLGDLTAQVNALQSAPSVKPADPPPPVTKDEASSASLLEAIKQLQKAVRDLEQNKARRPEAQRLKGLICYQCGERGHMLRDCGNPPNAELVQKRLLERSQRTGNEGGRQQGSSPAPQQQ